MRQFSWKHPWSNAADTYMAERLRERYLYCSPELDYASGYFITREEVDAQASR